MGRACWSFMAATCLSLSGHNSTSNKLHNIYPTLPINSNYPKAQLPHQEQTLYNHLRIGHTYLTHSYLLKDEDPPICNLAILC